MNCYAFSISILACLSAWAADAQAIPVVTLNLGSPSVNATSAEIDVSISFDADDSAPAIPDAGLTFIQLSVLGSGTSANVSDAIGSRFTFTKSSALNDWVDFDALFAGGLDGAVSFALDTSTFPGSALFDDGSSVVIGVLSVNLTGIAAGQTVTIDLLGSDTSFFAQNPVGDLNAPEEDVVLDLDGRIVSEVVTFEAQGQVQGAIPEPTTLCLAMFGVAMLGLRRRA